MRVDGVARGAGDGGNDGAVLAGDHVDEGALADIGAADDGDAGQAVGGVVGAFGEVFDEGVEEVARAAAGDAGDGVGVAEAEGVELGEAVHLGGVVDLVGGEDDGLGAAAQHVGDVLVHGCEAFAGVDEEEDDVGLVDSEGYLATDFDFEFVVAAHDVAAGVDDGEVLAVPVGVAVLAVAGDAGGGVDDGVAAFGEAVEEGGLADIGASDDGDDVHFMSCY